MFDAYRNTRFRPAKNRRDGNTEAAVLDAAESVASLLDVVFTVEGRVRPYNKFLRWELDIPPLGTTGRSPVTPDA